MLLRVYLIIEEGEDRVYVQTSFPAWYKAPAGRSHRVMAVDVPLPDVELVDRVIRIDVGPFEIGDACVRCGAPNRACVQCGAPNRRKSAI
jgi:hypothetical protein